MLLRQSRFVHLLPVGPDRILIVHAISQLRLSVTQQVADIIAYFATPHEMDEACEALAKTLPYNAQTIAGSLKTLIERGILTEKMPEEEMAVLSSELGETYGRDPLALLDRYRSKLKEGGQAAWTAATAQDIGELGQNGKRVDVILFGDCDIQMESDFLRRQAVKFGIDLRVSATFPDDLRFASEHKHDAIIIGGLRIRQDIVSSAPGQAHHSGYTAHVSRMLTGLRERTNAPILLDNLPEPTVQPLGMADRGLDGHRTRFRTANVVLADLVTKFADVHIVDIAAALNGAGAAKLIDDGQTGFTHFGSPGWLLQRPESEKAAVHNLFPDTAPLAEYLSGDPYGRETVTASAHVDMLVTVLGIGRKKCVIVDLDGTLWPGVLAETGSPFAWDPAISGPFSFVGLYFGIHEALLSLKKRGIVLACVSKNDEATVRELWRYAGHYPRQRLLTPDDFVTWRVNWNDKVDNIQSIAEELGFALDTFLFIDDHPVERDRVRTRLPEVEVWGEDLFAVRRKLLTDPRLQLSVITAEAAARTESTKAQVSRTKLRGEMMSEADYIASLDIRTRIERLTVAERLPRIVELFQRTTQFNATGRNFTLTELQSLMADPHAAIFSIDVADRFGDHGLVGAAVIMNQEILGFVLSCRVLGMGLEHKFLQYIIAAQDGTPELSGEIIETPRNIPVRNLYRDNGFQRTSETRWQLSLQNTNRQSA